MVLLKTFNVNRKKAEMEASSLAILPKGFLYVYWYMCNPNDIINERNNIIMFTTDLTHTDGLSHSDNKSFLTRKLTLLNGLFH